MLKVYQKLVRTCWAFLISTLINLIILNLVYFYGYSLDESLPMMVQIFLIGSIGLLLLMLVLKKTAIRLDKFISKRRRIRRNKINVRQKKSRKLKRAKALEDLEV